MKIKCTLKPVSLQASKPLCEAIEEEVNNFLKTRDGLKYLLLKYPGLSLLDSIKEYKTIVWQSNNF